ncbi:hypothetical protein MF672_028310 [Actinomadura sp. ATCC 31491]|uniref:Uncharacterized protein n=1 Tax=Actinomadura luzonensis TaxID=2805427 RepID=A0ABT0FZA5_9ACTN|nr:hypothetical protein [Actinomadura luzonensis]MCK2217667.1 hypothetical protein [Actinomadura luzonensis]
MTVTFTTHPSTADLLLCADPGRAAEELARVLDARRVLEDVQRGLHTPPELLAGEAARAGVELLRGIDLGSVLLNGWARYRRLREAARETLDNPGTGKVVPLAEHEIVSHHEPWIEVQVDGQPVARLTCAVDLVLHLTFVRAGVRAGRLVRLTGGDCEAAVVFRIEGVEVGRVRLVTVTLPLNRDLGEGYPLLKEARSAN